jgi:leucyl-tRNA synthetase
MSPHHPDVEQWLPATEPQTPMAEAPIAGPDASSMDSPLAIDTGRLVSGAGTKAPIPVLISSTVDAQFGPTAILGIPAVEQADADIAKQVNPPSGKAWRITDTGPSSLRSAQRRAARDMAISQRSAWGAPIPVVYCKACGAVPVAASDLPVRLPANLAGAKGVNELERAESFRLCTCPRCSAKARRETDTLHPRFDALWQWIAPCVQDIAANGLFESPELARWLPAKRAVREIDESRLAFDQRIGAKALRDAGLLSQLPDGEPFAGMTVHERVEKGRTKEVNHLDSLIKSMGADSVRLTMLYGAAPNTVLTWKGHVREYCHRWLNSFWEYAMPRLQKLGELGDIDEGQGAVGLRGRLEKWSRTAINRVTENYESVQMHRSARNVIMLVLRIQDFEQRVIDRHGQLTPADEHAIGRALLIAVQLIAPVTPHIAEELWAAAGSDGLVAAAAWPEIESSAEVP